jgi:hypothetical protein
MYLFVELWKARPQWLALSEKERSDYLATIGSEMERLLGLGSELVGIALNDPDTPYRSDYTYVSVWKIPSKELAQEFEQSVERVGFYDYFEQINTRGELISADTVMNDLIHLS